MYFTRKETLSIESYYVILPFFLSWFFFLDDKQNGTLNGPAYSRLVLGYLMIFSVYYIFVLMNKNKIHVKEPLIGNLIRLKSLKIIEIDSNIIPKTNKI